MPSRGTLGGILAHARSGQAHAISPDARSGILPALAPCELRFGILPALVRKAGSIGMGLPLAGSMVAHWWVLVCRSGHERGRSMQPRYYSAWPSSFLSDVIAISPNCRGGTRQSRGL
jgi:hypothetical protein